MNKVILIGRLARDPELRHTSNGMAVCQITVAISRRVSAGANPETDFINCTVWDKQAENVAKYLAKGRQVAVEGRIQTRSYDNNEGKKVYVTEVVCDSVQLLTPRSSDNNSYTPSYTQAPVENNYEPSESFDDFTSGVSLDISSDDLPF